MVHSISPQPSNDISARFAGHQVTALMENGLYRHLRFETPGKRGAYAFELITWPYNLVVKAGWTFHFSIDGTPDMFIVFRNTAFSGEINPGYWQQKVGAGRDEIEGFDDQLLKGQIASTLAQWMRDDLDGRVAKRARELGYTLAEVGAVPDIRRELAQQVRTDWRAANRKLRTAVHEHFFGDMAEYNVEYESEAHRALHDFAYTPEGEAPQWPYYFADWHEWRLKDFTPGFLHCCHAIRHGIDVYDAARKAVAA
jgi:hypothetical protein